MRWLAMPLVLLALASCTSTSTSPTGTVTGHVLASPCTPVERVGDSPCPGLPVAGASITFSMGSQAAAATTDASGAYSIALPVGTWQAKLASRPPFGQERTATVNVTASTTQVLDFHIDSGIR